MRNVSNAFRRALYENNRNYVCTAIITLTDNTVLTVTNAEIWQNGLSTNENVSDESTFGALGSVVVNSATLIINNIDEVYSQYDFTGAVVSINVGLLIGTSVESVKMGTFTVDDAQYNGALITLNCLDNMAKFDKPYSESTLVYPATLGTIVSNACTSCGVTLATPSFPNYNFQIDTRPTDTAITYREVISYAAVIAGCFAKCNNNGALELKWFDTDALQAEESGIDGGIFDITTADVYQSGYNVNGGTFNPWDTGDIVDGGSFTDTNVVHHITALSSQDFSVDPVIITGIQLTVDSTVNAELTTVDHLYGTGGYLIKVEKNPFITETNVDAIGNYLSTNLVGLTFRKANITHLNDPSIEAGDVAIVIDRKEKLYPILITNTTFNVSSYQTTICAADTPVRNSATRYSAITKSQVEAQTLVKQEKTLRQTMGEQLTQALAAKSGLYETREAVGTSGAYIYYLHDKPNLNESTAVIKITNEAVGVTPNYQATPVQWYGLTVDGNFIANIMSTIGIDFDWGTGGTLTLGGTNNVNGTLTMLNAGGTQVGFWNNSGLTLKGGQEDDTGIFFNDSNNNQIGVLAFSSTGNYLSMLSHTNIDILSINSAQTKSSNLILGRTNPYEWALVGDDYTNTKRTGFAYLPSVYGDFINVFGDLYFASNNKLRFITASDMALLKNYYDGTEYNLIRSHNNGSVSLSASSGTLYLGYENTTNIDILVGKVTISNDGAINSTARSGASTHVQAQLSSTGNSIYIQAVTDGKVTLGSRGANGTYYNILQRANNSSDITAYGAWTFNSGVKNAQNSTGTPITTIVNSANVGVSEISSRSSGLSIYGQWESSWSSRSLSVPSSDIRLKENIVDCIVTALPLINNIRMREFDWKDGRHQEIGFIADELEELDGKLAIGGGYAENGDMNIKSVDTFYLLGYAIKAIQELSAEVNRLKKKLGE